MCIELLSEKRFIEVQCTAFASLFDVEQTIEEADQFPEESEEAALMAKVVAICGRIFGFIGLIGFCGFLEFVSAAVVALVIAVVILVRENRRKFVPGVCCAAV